jgi:deoxyribonuclease (pyrimidine dimer)
MTRINTIDVSLLADQHLMAEYRELPMVTASLRRSVKGQSNSRILSKIPKQYTLNKGHVLFFYNKGQFLVDRYNALIDELYERKYNINPSGRTVSFDIHFEHHFDKTWTPRDVDHVTNCNRILQRINERRGWYRMKGELMNEDDYINTIKAKYYS